MHFILIFLVALKINLCLFFFSREPFGDRKKGLLYKHTQDKNPNKQNYQNQVAPSPPIQKSTPHQNICITLFTSPPPSTAPQQLTAEEGLQKNITGSRSVISQR